MPVLCFAQKRTFTLVIDAGHGGHDAGAVGAYSKEKNINLNVALAFGRLVEANCPDVKVIYTRRTDVFIPLQQRADIANRNKADLFISVHTNALPNGRIAYGSETYSLGMARASANLEVAKRENSVIMLENDYKTRYEGFDPNKAESYVIFEIMQDRFMKQSVELARSIQKQYAKAGRQDKGVHQAGFLVLRNTSMPSVLTELGFISTPAEEQYLNSKQGIEELSRSIYNGFLSYRRAHDKSAHDLPANLPSKVSAEETAAPQLSPSPDASQVAVVPVKVTPTSELRSAERKDSAPAVSPLRDTASHMALSSKQPAKASVAPSVSRKQKPEEEKRAVSRPAQKSAESSATKARSSSNAAQDKAKPQKQKDNVLASQGKSAAGKDNTAASKNKAAASRNASKQSSSKSDAQQDKAKSNATKDKGRAASAKDSKKATSAKSAEAKSAKSKVTYKIQVGAGKKEIEPNDPQFKGLSIKRVKEGTLYKYFYGSYSTHASAQAALKTVKAKLPGAYIVAYIGGKAASVADAKSAEKAAN